LEHQVRIAPNHVEWIELEAANMLNELLEARFTLQCARW